MRHWLLPLLPSFALGCGPGATTSDAPAVPVSVEAEPVRDVVDLRAQPPEGDDDFIDFVSPEVEIGPGEDRILCSHLRWDREDTAFNNQETFQGARYGHHATLVLPREPKPPGTLEDCSDVSTAAKYAPYTIAEKLPEGHAVSLPRGRALVLQFHYVNPSTKPILVRDVVRLHRVPVESVTTWTSVFVAEAAKSIAVPSKSKQTLRFDCTIPANGELLIVGGHMHERGTRIVIEHGPDASNLAPLHAVEEWRPEYRDAPPLTRYPRGTLVVKSGHVVRTTCSFDNPTDHTLAWPEEMCLTFAYLAGAKEPLHCVEGGTAG